MRDRDDAGLDELIDRSHQAITRSLELLQQTEKLLERSGESVTSKISWSGMGGPSMSNAAQCENPAPKCREDEATNRVRIGERLATERLA